MIVGQMPVFSLLVVSRSLMHAQAAAASIDEIVAASAIRNKRAAITSVLFFTGSHFAQIIEGSEPAVRALIHEMACDARHDALEVIGARRQQHRDLAGWPMLYVGEAAYLQPSIVRLSEASRGSRTRGALSSNMRGLLLAAALRKSRTALAH